MKPVRTRFAPSPTGYLHVGGVRTALFNYLLARKNGGQFVLRLEDTDRERFVDAGVGHIVESLDWLGLQPDKGFWISNKQHQNTEYVQSERHQQGFYDTYANKLLEQGVAYRDWTTPEQLTELREQAQQAKRPFIFRKDMASLHGDESRPHVLRFDVNKQAESSRKWQAFVEWEDAVRGHLHLRYDNIDDFVIVKSDGFPTYNFAHVIDDHDMGISHVLRGEEFIPSTPKHLLVYEALGLNQPIFAHLPVINGSDGKKLSKRTGDTNVLDYRDKGYLDTGLLNFLALLGWNSGTKKEIFMDLKELIEDFKLEQINTSPALFDIKRLQWINGVHIRDLPLEFLYTRTRGHQSMSDTGFWPPEALNYGEAYRQQVLELVQERLKYLGELPELTWFFFTEPEVDPSLIANHKQLKQLSQEGLKSLLEQARAALVTSDFTVEDLTKCLNQLLEETGQKPAVLFSLIRIATTQAPASPGLAATMAVLGKDRSLTRLDKQISAL